VHFGAVPMVMAHILIPVLAPFIAAYPGMSIDLIEKDDAQIEEAVISGELDCGVMTPWGSSRVAAHHLLTEEILLIVPRGHPLAAQPAAAFTMVAAETILIPRATLHVSNLIVEAFRRRGLAPKFSSRCNYPELNKALVRRGLGLAPMPKTLCSPAALEGLVAIPFEEPINRDLNLIYPHDRPLSSAARALVAYIRTHISKQGSA